VQGARNVLGAVGADHLKLFVSFGSIIARTGMRGEADYGLANEWLARLTGEWQAEHPHCRCLAVEWSVWSGVGMGERLGRIESLVQAGITPIPPGEGVAILSKLIAQPLPAASIVVAARFGQPPTLKMEQPDLPFLRFLEQSRVYYPGIELVIDADISFDADPYLQDHVYRGDALLPAVMGLEAMAEAVQALTGCTSLPSFHDVEFNRPIVVNGSSPLKVRIATLARTPGTIDVALRSEETGFQVDHFRATCHLEDSGLPASEFVEGEPTATARAELSSGLASEEGYLPLDPERHLYGPILFHTGRFRRLRGYKELRAKECLADIEPGPQGDWFGRYFPPELALGDPGMRDAAIHAVQACIPHVTLLPVRVDKLTICETQASCLQSVHARELSRDGDTFVYDLEVTGEDGRLVERWERLHLRRVDDKELPEPCAAPLLATYLERRMEELVPGTSLSVVIHQDKKLERSVRRDRAVRRIFGPAAAIIRRPDGKPEVANAEGKSISVSHSEDMTLVVAGQGETCLGRSGSRWQG
jgi:enediyne polyketide synthase